MSEPIFRSPNAEVTATKATIKGEEFAISDIKDVFSYDDGRKARRWAIFGAVGVGVISLIAAAGAKVGPGPLFIIPLLFGGVALLVYRLKSSLGTGLVVELKSGRATIINGLPRAEINQIRTTLADALKAR